MKLKAIIVWSALALAGCLSSTRPPVVTPPTPVDTPSIVINDPTFPQQCADIWQQELGRQIDPDGAWGCLAAFQRGDSGEAIREGVKASQEYRDRQDAMAAAIEAAKRLKPFTLDGRTWRQDGAERLPVLDDCLAILVRTPAERAAKLDEIKANGFDGCRVFAGDLDWAGQTAGTARAVLPAFMDEAAARGLHVLVSAVTGSRSGFDVPAHLRAVAGLLRGRNNVIGVECANEYWHPTQSSDVNSATWLAATCGPIMDAAGIRWDLGSPEFDEPQDDGWPIPSGTFISVHMDRSRDKWNQVRRIRELYAVSEVTGKAVVNAEMIGAAESVDPGRRENDPSFFFAAGVLGQAFKIAGVFHSEDGLNARLLGPVQAECARAFVAGYKAIPDGFHGQYQNVGWATSPIRAAQFTDTGGDIVRAYSFTSGDQAYVVVLHTSDVLSMNAFTLTDGWRIASPVTGRPHVSLFRVTQ